MIRALLPLLLFLSCSLFFVSPAFATGITGPSSPFAALRGLAATQENASGAYILERGEEALLIRAWMVGNANHSIDILTFIWSLDQIGLVFTDALLRAAERGVMVRAVVDDLVLKEEDVDILLALSAHPQFDIRIYNPQQTVGVSAPKVVYNLLSDFRLFNHRLHNKTFLVDDLIGLTGGRNVADEYFDNDPQHNFRDREILVAGPVATSMQANFERFWASELSRPIEQLLPERLASFSPEELAAVYAQMHACADQLMERLPVFGRIADQQDEQVEKLLRQMIWTPQIWFVSDRPGKNLEQPGLGGGGEMATALKAAFAEAQTTIVLQTPYLVLEGDGYGLPAKLAEGVEIRINTNSLASTDNIAAFSGYARQRENLLDAGFVIREFRPDPAIEEGSARDICANGGKPRIILHSKTLVVDGELLYVGTFNIDPRSAHLNTEEGVFVRNRQLAARVELEILRQMLPENSWDPRVVEPERRTGWARRFGLYFYRLLPIQSLL